MFLFQAFALLILTLFAYSVSAAATERRRNPKPTPIDLLAVFGVWLAGLWVRLQSDHWRAVGAVLLLAGSFAMLRGVVGRLRPADGETLRARAAREHDAPAASSAKGWRAFLLEVGNYQGRMTFAIMYFLLVSPFALIARVSGDPLQLRPRRSQQTFWIERREDEATITAAGRQF